MNHIPFFKYLKEGKQHIAYAIPLEDSRIRGLSVARILKEVTI